MSALSTNHLYILLSRKSPKIYISGLTAKPPNNSVGFSVPIGKGNLGKDETRVWETQEKPGPRTVFPGCWTYFPWRSLEKEIRHLEFALDILTCVALEGVYGYMLSCLSEDG